MVTREDIHDVCVRIKVLENGVTNEIRIMKVITNIINVVVTIKVTPMIAIFAVQLCQYTKKHVYLHDVHF